MENLTEIRLSELVFEEDVYPRASIDSMHVAELVEAIEAGAVLPPILMDAETRTIVDGVHRWRAMIRVHGIEATVSVQSRAFPKPRDMLLEAMRVNAVHGKPLSPWDRKRCKVMAARYRLGIKQLAAVLGVRPSTLQALGEGRTARAESGETEQVPLKRTIGHMAGKTLSADQMEANRKLCGMPQSYVLRQIVILLEANLLDTDNDEVMQLAQQVMTLLGEAIRSARAPVA